MAKRFIWAVIFFSLKASTSTLVALNSRFSNSLKLHTQAIYASRLGFIETSIVSFLDPPISSCPLAKKHSPSLNIVDINIEICNAFAWGGGQKSFWTSMVSLQFVDESCVASLVHLQLFAFD